ncbi:MAG TPA: hypothetical protein PKE06_09320 [Flavilitoribacter sp.]|nr:hypothetical protein [Flavilitoribacter sp.]HMQ86819.1 hypothetical protein [Flavilitoribacter sp.]
MKYRNPSTVKFLFLLASLLPCPGQGQSQAALPPWQEGFLDIHHISTGRGDAAYLIFPDGTTLLVDAGDISDTHPRTLSPRNTVRKPDNTRSTGAWIADYIRQFAPAGRPPVLDYALITHYHDDHFGEWDENRPISPKGGYRLTGMMEVGDLIPIHVMLDRGFDFPINLKSEAFAEGASADEYHILQTLREYWKFIEFHQKNNGLVNEAIRPGSSRQITLKYHPEDFPGFLVRNISSNGRIWTGYAEGETFQLFQDGQYPGENPLSNAVRISFGHFDYFTGGDISGMNPIGESDMNSVEANLAPVVGPVDAATLNHHGNRDSQSPYYVRTLRPRVWIQQNWSSDHPGEEVLRRITAKTLYPGERDLFSTDMLEANELVIGDRIGQSYKSRHGHVVIRVYDNGARFKVFILDDGSAKREVIGVFGPYEAR